MASPPPSQINPHRPPSPCHGNSIDHCCYVDGQVCPFLETNTVEGRYWACGLYRELGDWDLVHSDPRYLDVVRPVWDEHGVADCGDWGPGTGQCCYGGR